MDYDIAIVGSGIAGSTLAMVLRKVGASVIVLERDAHPRFAIGESTVPASTLAWTYLAERYDLPDLLSFCHYPGLKESGLTGYPKNHFWFALHREGQPLDPQHQAMFETYPVGIGPDVHMLRADVDAHLVSRLPDHGIEYRDHTAVVGFEHDGAWGTLALEGPGGAGQVRARLVFDATGHGALFGRMLGLRDEEPRLHTHTRALFGHFRGVQLVEPTLPPEQSFRYSRDAGTQHHCFEGGWAWVIPFDDGVASLGIMLDTRAFPLDPSVSPEDEWAGIIDRFPSLKQLVGQAEPIRPLARTGRVQFTSRGITAPGVVLTPHAAAFVDPLYSTGLTQTGAFVCRVAPIVARCLADGDFDHRRFAAVERAFLGDIEVTDKIVAGTIASFGDWEVFRQFWQTWILGTNLQVSARVGGDQSDPEGAALEFGRAAKAWSKEIDRRFAVVNDAERPPIEKAYALEMFQASCRSWREHWRWMKAQRAAAGPGPMTARRMVASVVLRLLRPILPVVVHAENPFVKSYNHEVHSPGPISVQVPDPADSDFHGWRVWLAFRVMTLGFGGREKFDPAGWQAFAERARRAGRENAAALSAESPSVMAAALRAMQRRAAGEVSGLREHDPLLVRPELPRAERAPRRAVGHGGR